MKIPDLTATQRRVFSAIYATPRSSMSDLATLLGVCRQRVAVVVGQLERLGLITSRLFRVPGAGGLCPPYRLRLCVPAPWVLA